MSEAKAVDTVGVRELHAVVEAVSAAPAFVTGLPALPWPTWIRLSGDADEASVALVIAVRCAALRT